MIELFRTSTFRLALIYFGLFATSVLGLLGFVYWQTVVYADQQTGETIDAEITGLAEQYHQRGLEGLVEVIADRSQSGRAGDMLYLLADGRQRPLAGNLSRWPDATVKPDGWMYFSVQSANPSESSRHVVQATSFLLAGGYQLLVGRDLAERLALTDRIVLALAWAAGLTLGLGVVGGMLMSRRVLSRIEAINRSADLVMTGELNRRIPARAGGDEFDRLARNLNAMLERIEVLMGGMRQVSDNIAHDLRSPLGRLRSRLEMASRQPVLDQDEMRAVLAEAIADADQLLATFSALLDIASAEAGSLQADMVSIDLTALLRGLADFYDPVADEAGLRLIVDLPDAALCVRGNQHLLSRCFANLIDNAIKYTPAPGLISIGARLDAGSVHAEIADTGAGIPEAARERVFDRFVRLENSRTSPGSGLGLSLVRAIVTWHGGSITLEDNAPGVRVRVQLPAPAPAEECAKSVTRSQNDTRAMLSWDATSHAS